MISEEKPDAREPAVPGAVSLSRRQFLKRLGVLGGGIIVYFTVGDRPLAARMKREGFLGSNVPTDFNAFLRVGTDGRVTCLTGKIEMGQGPITSLPQMLAEELDVSCDAVDMVMGDTDLCPWDAGTFGSLTTRHFGVFLREAACEAKAVLKTMAADHLNCPVDRLQTRNGVVFDKTAPGKRVTYGRLTRGNIIERHLADLPPLKPVSDFTVMGKSFLHRDAVDKVTGKAMYAGDVRLPGMLYARILRPPAHGARLQSIDTAAAETVENARVVQDGDLIAVVHERPDQAAEALSRIAARFETPKTGIDDRTIFDHLVNHAPSGQVASEKGNLASGKARAATVVSATYRNGYVAHAPMETHTAAARVQGDKITVWASTQTPFRVQQQVADALQVAPGQVRIITPFVGGGFGGKSASAQAVEAARLARITGRPVQVAWSREEEFFLDTFRPAAVVNIDAGLDHAGKMTFWDYHVYFAGKRGCSVFYDIPHHRETVYGSWRGHSRGVHPFAVGAWRAPANNTNTHARELHLNLMAARAGVDALAFRLDHLTDLRMIRVLKAAARKFGWTPGAVPSGRGWGIACGIDAGTYVAAMAAVDVDKNRGTVSVRRVVCAQDMGFAVNPQGARIQMEGCITMGLGYALSEEIRFRDGRISDLNFDTYSLPRFSWLPQIETVIVDNPVLAPQGGGEPAVICMGGVIATAIHDATGARLYQLPMTPERVKMALDGETDAVVG